MQAQARAHDRVPSSVRISVAQCLTVRTHVHDVEPRALANEALLEAIEIAGAYSSFYTADENRQRLEFLVNLGLAGPEMERRLQLVRARCPTPA